MVDIKKGNSPKLRFSQFTTEWNKKRLSDIATFSKGGVLSKADLSKVGHPCILYGELYTKYGEVIRNVVSKTNVTNKNLIIGYKNDLLIPSSGETAIDIACAAALEVNNVFIGGDLNVLRLNDSINGSFLSYQINHTRKRDLAKVAQGATIVHLYNEDLKSVSVFLPEEDEQHKIASFFSLFDQKIEKQVKKIEQLELYKKGMMQKIFRQKIRFKTESGMEYPDWQRKKLGDILKERKTYSSKNSSYPHVTLSKDGIYEKNERYNRDFLVKEKDKKYKITKLNDICYNPANLKFGVICKNDYGNAIFSPIYATFEVSSNFNPSYLGYYLTRRDFIDKVRKYEEGTVYERMAVKPEDFLKYSDHFPSKAEQDHIAGFLDTLTNKIKKENIKLDKLTKLKKSYLQQMFI